ncbi:MAG: hypothetical protein ABSD12_17670 [Paraburkholderia sp.]|jgi:hypothetical protein
MNHLQLEKDIEHLENLLPRIATVDRPLPLSYWRDRVDGLSGVARVPSQVSRVKRLKEALRALEERAASAGVRRGLGDELAG